MVITLYPLFYLVASTDIFDFTTVYSLPPDILSTLQQQQGDLVSNIPDAQDLAETTTRAKSNSDGAGNISITSAKGCSLCTQTFSTVEEQRSHIRSDLHKYNLKQKLQGLEAVSETVFETLIKGYTSCICRIFWARLIL